jgi:hypothetical protein
MVLFVSQNTRFQESVLGGDYVRQISLFEGRGEKMRVLRMLGWQPWIYSPSDVSNEGFRRFFWLKFS